MILKKINFTKKLLEFAKNKNKFKKIIHLSSAIIYDNENTSPVLENDKLYLNYSNYSFTKGMSEHYVNFYRETFGLPIIIFRLSNIYGPYQNVNDSPFLVPSKIVEALTKKEIVVYNLKPKRDWIYSEDAAEAIVRSLTADYSGILNLASGKGSSVDDIISEIAKQTNVPYSSLEKDTNGPLDFYCDISKIKKVLDWTPVTDIPEGIKKTVDYIKKNIKL